VGSVLIGLILDVLLIPRAGVTGAAIAASVGLLVLAVWLYALNVKLLDLRPSIVDALLVSVRSGRDSAPAR
jgi:O-antigen/teichoic acid export membrane protein